MMSQGIIRHQSLENEKVILGATLDLQKILSRPELLPKSENYVLVARRQHFSGIKMESKISFHRHFKIKQNVKFMSLTSIK